jgi:D-alanyl-D-alanine carboxypeptidase
MTVRNLTAAALVAGCAAMAAAQPRVDAQAGIGRQRIDAFFRALSKGNADAFEAMAKEHFQPEMLARRTPADRRQMVERLRADFGEMTLERMERRPDGVVTLAVRGATGLRGRIELRLEAEPPERIMLVGIEVGDVEPGGEAPPPPGIDGGMSADDMARALDAYLAPMVASEAFSGVVLIARAGVPVYEKAFGLADRERGIPNATGTRFNIGSINKIFTKTAIAQLIAQGKVKLTDTLGALLPDHPNEVSRAATVDQLLNHQGGIADFFGPAFDAAPKGDFRSNADYYRFVASQPPAFAPGARRQYCNGCYIVLGAIIEKISGQRYEDYIAQNIYAPARMTTAGPTGPGAATGYTRRAGGGEGPLRSNAALHGVSGSAAGGGYAAARDLLAFDEALRAGRLADAARTAWLLQVDAVTSGRSEGGVGVAGGAPGLNAILESSREWTVVVLANLDPPAAQQLGVAIHRQLSR